MIFDKTFTTTKELVGVLGAGDSSFVPPDENPDVEAGWTVNPDFRPAYEIPNYIRNGSFGAVFNFGNGDVEQTQEFTLGTPSRPWGAIYAELGVITTSDRDAKRFIKDSTLGLGFIMQLRPVSFSLLSKNNSDATYGFIGQEVETALKGNNFSGLLKSDSGYALRYADFIAPMVKAMQQQQTQIKAMEESLSLLRREINQLKQQG